MLIISMLVKQAWGRTGLSEMKDMPGHLARRFQQIAVAVFLAEVEAAGFDQITLAGLIAYDRTTITGVIDRLAQKGLVVRQASARDRRSRELLITDEGRRTLDAITPAVEAAQRLMVRGLSDAEARELVRLMQKAIAAGNELSRAPLREGASER